MVLQPWSSGLNPKPLDIYLRIHLVLDSSDAVKPTIVSQIVPYREQMQYVCESKTQLNFEERIMKDRVRTLARYGYDVSCVTFSENVLDSLVKHRVVVRQQEPSVQQQSKEHQDRQRNTTTIGDYAKVLLANVEQVVFVSENFYDLVFFVALLGGPFVGLGVLYFVFAALVDAFQGVELVFHAAYRRMCHDTSTRLYRRLWV